MVNATVGIHVQDVGPYTTRIGEVIELGAGPQAGRVRVRWYGKLIHRTAELKPMKMRTWFNPARLQPYTPPPRTIGPETVTA